MKTKLYFTTILILGGLTIFGFTIKSSKNKISSTTESRVQGKSITEDNSSSPLQSQTANMGAVDVKITPKQLEANKKIIFEITLDTHSVDLNYDFTQIYTLTDNNGKNYQVLEWIGGQGGHHLAGKLIFETLNNNSETITLEIDGIDKKTNNFTWNL